jgi:beta-mannosidase
VRRLRNHPSLALWCGNNENQWGHEQEFWDRPIAEQPPYGALYYDRILPDAVAELDGRTPYWPGSPFGGSDHNAPEDGDVHNWEAWHGNFRRRFGEPPRHAWTPENVSYLRYAEDMGRFVSEFGLHASPGLESLRPAIPEDQLFHHSPSMDWHTKDEPKNKGDNLMLGVTGLPTSLDEYIDFSQLSQAEGLKFGVEHFRRRRPHCSGALVWQLNDCWPGTSWSVLDYYGVGKAGYFYLRRAFVPVLASFKALDDGSVELWVTNDTLAEFEDTAMIRLRTFVGRDLAEERVRLRVGPGGSQPVWHMRVGQVDAGPEHYLVVRSDTAAFPPNRHFFAAIKDLRRPSVHPQLTSSAFDSGGLRLTVRAPYDGYVLFAHVAAGEPATRFSDNFFDLEPGEERTLSVSHPTRPLSATDLRLGSR